MLFLTIVGWGVFIFTSALQILIHSCIVWDSFFRSEADKRFEAMRERMEGRVWGGWNWRLIGFLFILWFFSGAYIFGAFA
jgi:hypothetical protein